MNIHYPSSWIRAQSLVLFCVSTYFQKNLYISQNAKEIYIFSEVFIHISKCEGNIHILRRLCTYHVLIRRIWEGQKDLLRKYTHPKKDWKCLNVKNMSRKSNLTTVTLTLYVCIQVTISNFAILLHAFSITVIQCNFLFILPHQWVILSLSWGQLWS